jgi:hypothetical protein
MGTDVAMQLLAHPYSQNKSVLPGSHPLENLVRAIHAMPVSRSNRKCNQEINKVIQNLANSSVIIVSSL